MISKVRKSLRDRTKRALKIGIYSEFKCPVIIKDNKSLISEERKIKLKLPECEYYTEEIIYDLIEKKIPLGYEIVKSRVNDSISNILIYYNIKLSKKGLCYLCLEDNIYVKKGHTCAFMICNNCEIEYKKFQKKNDKYTCCYCNT
jgi:hypothetical protein